MAKKKKGKLFGKPRSKVVKHPGAFSRKAEEHGQSTSQFIKTVEAHPERYSAQTRKQAGLAKAFQTMRRKKRHKGANKTFKEWGQ
jgi:hypothetical protein